MVGCFILFYVLHENVVFQKYLVFAFCVCLCRGSPEADLLTTLKAEQIPLNAQVLSGPPLVEYLQKSQKLFEVSATPTKRDFQHRLMDLMFVDQNRNPPVDEADDNWDDIPESFDARVQWHNCSSLFYIRDQANCGSCWAVSSAAAMSDRICIASHGAKQVQINDFVLLSDQDMLACCSWCGYGCEGGWPLKAWEYFADEGVVTGGNYRKKVIIICFHYL
ncbi:papain family cysteine protease [Teladorsagia circumcincta]|uniref:Papain family cysteine protease n=1 Tax=Teladorsagia circumcincta TaxID=45464 RepID=A0A2G9UL68_TELCI|nr:papain family cysteine protease [Teladorsagia circumcincta]